MTKGGPQRVTTSLRYVSPLRYPGGKAKLAGFIKVLLRRNGLLDAQYVEPYAGGASVAFTLLLGEYVSHVHVNDLDQSVFAFWHSVLHETEALCRLVRNIRVTPTQWRKQKTVQDRPCDFGLLERGFSTFFLNRTNRSGIICSGGMIGGREQSGTWKIDARYNKQDLVRRIERIADYRDRISLYGEDAANLLARLLPTLPYKTLLYLDPPYYVKGTRRLYANFYEHKDHAQVANLVKKTRHPWVVSYDDTPEIRRLYRGSRRVSYQLAYTARDRYRGSEVLFLSNHLSMPRAPRPIEMADTAPPRPHRKDFTESA